ncbi:MAG: hypothetical protein MK312_09995 [Roseibacillus sp.]|nr:hypothetical protein [Roseibacillus sp.]
MKQLVQLREKMAGILTESESNIVVIFREEQDGQRGLRKVADKTQVSFALALDTPARQTSGYSQGDRVHDSYIIDKSGVIRSVLKGTRHDRAQAGEFARELEKIIRSGK